MNLQLFKNRPISLLSYIAVIAAMWIFTVLISVTGYQAILIPLSLLYLASLVWMIKVGYERHRRLVQWLFCGCSLTAMIYLIALAFYLMLDEKNPERVFAKLTPLVLAGRYIFLYGLSAVFTLILIVVCSNAPCASRKLTPVVGQDCDERILQENNRGGDSRREQSNRANRI